MTTVELNNDNIILKDPNTNLYKCTTCSYYTPLRNSFMKHLKTDKHKINEKPLKCENCSGLFYTKISFNNHVKSCLIQDMDTYDNDIEDESPDETICDNDKLVEYDEDQDLGLLLQKFGNEYDKLMIKYILLFFLKIKENMVPFNLLLIFVFFMWTR
jgi:hypothetical protein